MTDAQRALGGPDNSRSLAVGQWLGTGNKIVKMQRFRYGWKATDSTEATYRQPDFPDGLFTADTPTPGNVLMLDGRERTPWPE